MIFGENISLNSEAVLYDLIEKIIKIFRKTRKEEEYEELFNDDLDKLLKKINLYENSLVLKNIAFKIVSVKVSNVQKSGILNFYNKNTEKKKKVVYIFKNISQKAFLELIKLQNIEVFTYSDILQFPLDSILQPEFFLISKDEKKTLLEEFNVTEKNLPKIKVSDIICRLYSAKVNDVLKIIRKTPEYGYDIYYRLVIPSNYDDVFDI